MTLPSQPCPTCGGAWARGRVETLAMPYSRPPLNLNDRRNRREHAAVVARLRRDAQIVCRAAHLGRWQLVRIGLFWQPGLEFGKPTGARTRDAENLVASQKPICDGLQDAGLVPNDDAAHMERLQPVILPEDNTRPGRLWVEVELIR